MSRRAYCSARAAGTGRQCRAHGCWKTAGPSADYCKRHAQEVAAFTDDPRIVNTRTGRIEMVDGRRLHCRPRGGPDPIGLDEITAELRTVRCRLDWQRCRRAIFAQLDDLVDRARDSANEPLYVARLKPALPDALHVARGRLQRIGELA